MKHPRKRLFIDSAFQGQLLIRLAAYWFGYHVVLWHMLFALSVFSELVGPPSARGHRSVATHYRDFAAENTGIIVCFFVTLPVIARNMLKFSHRIVGPLVRFRDVMGQMVRGERVGNVSLRPRDLPTDFLGVFNQLIDTWNARVPGQNPQQSDKELNKELELVETA
jgi:hypothetical protein